MFDLAFGRTMPGLSQLVALLHIVGKAHVADKIVTSLIKSRRVYEDQLKKAIQESGEEIDLGDILKEVQMATTSPVLGDGFSGISVSKNPSLFSNRSLPLVPLILIHLIPFLYDPGTEFHNNRDSLGAPGCGCQYHCAHAAAGPAVAGYPRHKFFDDGGDTASYLAPCSTRFSPHFWLSV